MPLGSPAMWLFAAGAALASWPGLRALADVYRSSGDYSHGFLVPLFAAFVVWDQNQTQAMRRGRPSLLGLLPLLVGCLLLILAEWYAVALRPSGLGVATFAGLGILSLLTSGCLLHSGWCGLRNRAFPLAFLVFAIPLPLSLSQPLTLLLQRAVSTAAEPLVRLFGVSIYREGNVMHLANASLGVDDACSGIRSLWMLIAAACALGYAVGLRPSRLIALCFVSVPAAVLANIARVVLTALLTQQGLTSILTGWQHETMGWLTFAAAFLGLLLIARKIQTEAPVEPVRPGATVLPSAKPLAISTGLLLLATVTHLGITRHYLQVFQPATPAVPLAQFPQRVGAFIVTDQQVLRERQDALLNPTDSLIRSYAMPGSSPVELRIMRWAPSRQHYKSLTAQPHLPDVCYPNWGFREDPHYHQPGIIQERLFLRDHEAYFLWYQHRSRVTANISGSPIEKLRLLLRSWHDPVVDHGAQFLVVVLCEAQDPAGARETVRAFAQQLQPLLPAFGCDLP